jgi:hypothetical protein
MPESTDRPGATGALIVMARPPASIGDDEFRSWFKGHLPEILEIECFTGARLLEIQLFASAPGRDLPFRYMAVYDFVGTPESAMSTLAAFRAGGGMKLPGWFDEFEAGDYLVSWTGVPA